MEAWDSKTDNFFLKWKCAHIHAVLTFKIKNKKKSFSVLKDLSASNAKVAGDTCSNPGLGRSSGEGHGNPSLVLPGESHGQRSLAG